MSKLYTFRMLYLLIPPVSDLSLGDILQYEILVYLLRTCIIHLLYNTHDSQSSQTASPVANSMLQFLQPPGYHSYIFSSSHSLTALSPSTPISNPLLSSPTSTTLTLLSASSPSP